MEGSKFGRSLLPRRGERLCLPWGQERELGRHQAQAPKGQILPYRGSPGSPASPPPASGISFPQKEERSSK